MGGFHKIVHSVYEVLAELTQLLKDSPPYVLVRPKYYQYSQLTVGGFHQTVCDVYEVCADVTQELKCSSFICSCSTQVS